MSDLTVHVLLVEDNPGYTRLILEMLRDATHFPCHLRSVDRLDASLACLDQGGVDVVLLDLMLPDSSGFDTFARVHAHASQAPILVLSNLDDEALAIQSLRQGAQDYLVKAQVDSALLVRAIRYAIERKRIEEELYRSREKMESLLAENRRLYDQTQHELTEREKAEAALERSERFLNNIVENIPDMIFVKDAEELKFVRFNKAGEDLLGVARDELYGKTDFDIMPEYIAEQYLAKDREVLRNKQLVDIPEEPTQTKYHGIRTLHTKKIPLLDEEGRPQYLLGISEDITERRQAELALRESENLWRTYIENANDLIIILDPAGRITSVNQAVCALSGYGTEELLGQNLLAFITSDYIAAAAGALEKVLRGQKTEQVEVGILTKDGDVRMMEAHSSVFFKEDRLSSVLVIGHDISERKRAEELIRQQLATLTALYSGAQKLAVNLDSLRLAEDIARICVEEFGVSLAGVGRAETDGRMQVLAQFPLESNYLRQVTARWDDTPHGHSPVGETIRTSSPVIVDDLLHDPRVTPWLAAYQQYGLRSGAVFPLISRQKAFGALTLYSDQPGYFTTERVDFFQSYALQGAAALENARLFEETERRLSHMEALRRIDTSISSSLDLRTTLDVIVDQATTQLRVDAASVLLLVSPSLTFTPTAARGFRTHAIQDTHLRLGQGYAGLAALERCTIVNDTRLQADEGQEATHYRSLMSAEGFVAHIATPLIAKGQVVGVLEVFHRTPLVAGGEWLAFLETLARQTAIAIDSATLFTSLQRSNTELELAYDATLEGWSRALDLRDQQTEGHTQRVAEIALRLARILGLSGVELLNMRRGALLHDMGKMGVPDAILLKSGPLSPEEWVIMRRHPQYAHDMLFPIRYLRLAIDIPYCHHEKWDGSGYPRGLQGEQIPLAARIFAVVDVWDALTSDRPYRPAWPEDKAREYIRAQAGTHFDPQVVEAFLSLNTAV
jgi:PAS domain S-box-containing protein